MKALVVAIMALSISSAVFAADLNQISLDTLLSAPSTRLVGDVRPEETVVSIFVDALEGNANIKNECKVSGAVANCTLWLTYSPMGETALEYTVTAAGDQLLSNLITVSRGD